MREASGETVLEKHQDSSQKQAKMAYNVTRYTTHNGLRITALENPDGTVKLLRFGKHTWGKCSMASYQNLNALKASYPPAEEKASAPRSTIVRYIDDQGQRVTALVFPDGKVRVLRLGDLTWHTARSWGKYSMASYQNLNALKASYPPAEEKAPAPRSSVTRYIDDQGERVTALVLPDGKVRILRYGAVTWRTARTTATYESVEELHKYVTPRQEAPTSNTYEPGTVIRGTSWVGRVTGLVLRNGMVRVLRQGSHTHRNGQITNHCKNVEDFLSQFKLESHHATFRG